MQKSDCTVYLKLQPSDRKGQITEGFKEKSKPNPNIFK